VSPTELATPATEHDPVRAWRLDQLRRAGYPLREAVVLSARKDLDIHQATDLLRQGCPLETAIRILV